MSSFLRLLSLCLLFTASTGWAQSFSLPIWKEEAEALGYVLPKPFGFNLSYMSLEQGIAVDSIGLSGLDYSKLGVGNLLKIESIDMKAKPGKQTSDVLSLRGDVWLFPFLNVYALVGKMKGYSETSVDVSVKTKIFGKEKIINHRIDSFKLDLDGDLYGGGLVLAGGYGNWFGLVDASFTKTNLTIIDGSIDAIVVSPRFGYDFHSTGVPLRLWAGAMYQDVEQSLSGKLSDLGLPKEIAGLVENGRFDVEQRLTTKWNPIVGMQYQVNPNFYLLGEAGLGDRKSIFLSIDMRY
ncbi:TonB-dependent receptor [Parasalinivibrio latis]|uniref:TonB-dependent receptor n=1 Tax=Parasalinivibrio latis TaxID=2952610 RepID=UPI0030E11D0E